MATSGDTIHPAQSLELLKHVISHQEQRKSFLKQKIFAAVVSGLPISNDTMEDLKCIMPHEAIEMLSHHPGAKTSRRIESITIALETFNIALQDLLSSLDLFNVASGESGYFNPVNRSKKMKH